MGSTCHGCHWFVSPQKVSILQEEQKFSDPYRLPMHPVEQFLLGQSLIQLGGSLFWLVHESLGHLHFVSSEFAFSEEELE